MTAIFLYQVFEWIAMLFIIHTQHKRRLEEIMWDYNNENMNDDNSDKLQPNNGKAFRRKERRLGVAFRIIFYLMLPIHLALIIAYYLTSSSQIEKYLISVNALSFLVGTATFMKVYHSMYYTQWYEFQRTRC